MARLHLSRSGWSGGHNELAQGQDSFFRGEMNPASDSSIPYVPLQFRWARDTHSCRTKRSSPIRKRNCLRSSQARQLASEARRALNCSAGLLWLLPSVQAMLISMETHSKLAREQGRFPPPRSFLKGHRSASRPLDRWSRVSECLAAVTALHPVLSRCLFRLPEPSGVRLTGLPRPRIIRLPLRARFLGRIPDCPSTCRRQTFK